MASLEELIDAAVVAVVQDDDYEDGRLQNQSSHLHLDNVKATLVNTAHERQRLTQLAHRIRP